MTGEEQQQISEPKVIAPASNSAGRKRKSRGYGLNAEQSWRLLFCFMVPLFFAIFYSIFEFHQRLDKDNIPYGNFTDLPFAVAAACFWHIIKTSWEYNTWPKILPYVEDKHQGLERIHRAKRISKWFFDFLYYSFFTIAAYILFYPIIPDLLFGEKSCWDTFSTFPYPVNLRWVKEFYLIQMGSLLQKIVDQLVKKRDDVKFWEYFLHHFLAFCLVFQSYVSNYHQIGILVLLTHDTTDIFLSFTRAQEALRYKIPVFFPAFFIMTFFVWTYFRGIAYTYCDMIPSIIHVYSKHFPKVEKYAVGNHLSDAAFAVQLVFLAIMNYYWIFALARIFYKNIKGKAAAKIIFGSSYENSYDPTLLKATSIVAVK